MVVVCLEQVVWYWAVRMMGVSDNWKGGVDSEKDPGKKRARKFEAELPAWMGSPIVYSTDKHYGSEPYIN